MSDEIVLSIAEAEAVAKWIDNGLTWHAFAYASIETVARMTGYSEDRIREVAGRSG